MTDAGSSGGLSGLKGGAGAALFCPLVLFACTVKLWLALNDARRRPSNDDDDAPPPSSSPPPTPSSPSPSRRPPTPREKPMDGAPARNNSLDASDLRASLGASFNSKPVRGMSEEERSLLMERVAMSDCVLTRETSLDFHPKNSNWSHFEKFHKWSPNTISENEKDEDEEGDEEEEEEGEEFIWSEPPTKDSTADLSQYSDERLRNTRHSSGPLSRQNSLAFNAGFLPSKLILVRHGQSEGNVDESMYATKPDNAMRLTKLGWEMARMAGKALREQLPPDETVHFIVSPYARTVETFHGIVSAWCDPEEFAQIQNRSKRLKLWYTKLMEMGLTWHEDPRIREQDFGNYQDPQVIKKAKSERHRFGSFYYRFPHGESASDVFDRVSTFLDSLWRSFESGRAQNYVLVAHGISIRVFLTRYFRYSIDQFHTLANPKNCEMVTLGHDGLGRLTLEGRCELELKELAAAAEEEGRETGEGEAKKADGRVERKGTANATVVTGYKKHSKLRTLPPQYVQPRTMRMCWNDD